MSKSKGSFTGVVCGIHREKLIVENDGGYSLVELNYMKRVNDKDQHKRFLGHSVVGCKISFESSSTGEGSRDPVIVDFKVLEAKDLKFYKSTKVNVVDKSFNLQNKAETEGYIESKGSDSERVKGKRPHFFRGEFVEYIEKDNEGRIGFKFDGKKEIYRLACFKIAKTDQKTLTTIYRNLSGASIDIQISESGRDFCIVDREYAKFLDSCLDEGYLSFDYDEYFSEYINISKIAHILLSNLVSNHDPERKEGFLLRFSNTNRLHIVNKDGNGGEFYLSDLDINIASFSAKSPQFTLHILKYLLKFSRKRVQYIIDYEYDFGGSTKAKFVTVFLDGETESINEKLAEYLYEIRSNSQRDPMDVLANSKKRDNRCTGTRYDEIEKILSRKKNHESREVAPGYYDFFDASQTPPYELEARFSNDAEYECFIIKVWSVASFTVCCAQGNSLFTLRVYLCDVREPADADVVRNDAIHYIQEYLTMKELFKLKIASYERSDKGLSCYLHDSKGISISQYLLRLGLTLVNSKNIVKQNYETQVEAQKALSGYWRHKCRCPCDLLNISNCSDEPIDVHDIVFHSDDGDFVKCIIVLKPNVDVENYLNNNGIKGQKIRTPLANELYICESNDNKATKRSRVIALERMSSDSSGNSTENGRDKVTLLNLDNGKEEAYEVNIHALYESKVGCLELFPRSYSIGIIKKNEYDQLVKKSGRQKSYRIKVNEWRDYKPETRDNVYSIEIVNKSNHR